MHLGKCLSAETIPILEQHRWFSEGLWGRVVEIKGPGEIVYSADLTAATDEITFDRASAVVSGLSIALNWTQERRAAALAILGSQALESDKDWSDRVMTTCGVYLGLGISWTVLSLLNAFAAWSSSEHPSLRDKSFGICGDDLKALWDHDRADRYEANLEDLGLRVNKRKSFRARRGVYCEKLVSKDNLGKSRTTLVCGIREAAGAKLFARAGRNGTVAVREGLTLRLQQKLPRPTRRLIQLTLKATHIHGMPSGPGRLGGDGGPVSVKDRRKWIGLIGAWARYGNMPLVVNEHDPTWKRVVDARDKAAIPHTDHKTYRTVMARWSNLAPEIISAHARYTLNEQREKPRERPINDLARMSARRQAIGRPLLRLLSYKLVAACFGDRLSRTGHHRLRRYLSHLRKPNPNPYFIRMAIRTLATHGRDIAVIAPIFARELEALGLRSTPLQNGERKEWAFIRKIAVPRAEEAV